ncbi:MAG: M13 family metallopeptidase [Fimbriimonadaceae bacterium]|nr:M13 family metallopeptidase [Chitinophagales bacterium]
MYKRLFFLFISFVIIASCKNSSTTSEDKDEADKYAYFLNDYIDTTVNPGDDFFKYAMGTWLKNNPVPASENSWGIWSLVLEETRNRVKLISEEAASNKNPKKGSNEQKIGDFWHTGMDSVTIEAQGIKPLEPEFEKIHAMQTTEDVINEIAYLQSIGVPALYTNYIFQDEKNSNKFMIHLYQGGIGLPERDYYFATDERTKNIRTEYVKHIAKMFQLMGLDEAASKKNAETIMRMETDLAKASRKIEDLRDPYTNYNKMDIAAANNLTPALNWADHFTKTGAPNIDSVIIGQPEFFTQMNKSLKNESIDNWKVYLHWNLINAYAGYLNNEIDRENFNFYGTILYGTKEQRPRWKRVLDAEENAMGFILGELYVQKYYSPEEKARYIKIVDNTIEAYKERITALDWMSDSTKQKAIAKLNTVMKKVGYPDTWQDYSTLEVERDSYVLNGIRAAKYYNAYQIAHLYKPVDRTEWGMTPQTWNAYYNPGNNEIVLPAAAFVVPGVPDKYVDDAIAYGYAAGSTIGHELTHGFDDQGSQFDAQGNLVNWWTTDDRNKFLDRTKMIVQQFDAYMVLDSMHINGDATQGENIADLGGMLVGLEAFKKTEAYKSGKMIGGFTPTQRYFLGFALSWYGKYRDEALAVRIKSDVHSPNFLRVNGPAVNIDDFYSAFNIKPTDKMYVPDSLRVRIW